LNKDVLTVETLVQWYSTWAKSPPRGPFCDLSDLGAIAVSRRRFL